MTSTMTALAEGSLADGISQRASRIAARVPSGLVANTDN
jgi:hypothetical protein